MIHKLIGLGFWRSLFEPAFPDPAWFVDELRPAKTRGLVISYLQQGHPICVQMGYSWCRFRCPVPVLMLGTADLTDGTYSWPAGLVHYVQEHQLRLPDVVVEHMLAQTTFPHLQAAQVAEASPLDMTWWCQQKGWQQGASSFISSTDQEVRDYLGRYDRGMIYFDDHAEEAHRAREQMVQELRRFYFL